MKKILLTFSIFVVMAVGDDFDIAYEATIAGNLQKAITYYKKTIDTSTDEKRLRALFNLASVYDGLKDYQNAFKYFNQAANEHYPPALYAMGLLYWYGHGVNKNLTTACSYLKEANGAQFKPAGDAVMQLYKQSPSSCIK